MKPVSESAFSVILESYLEAIHGYISNATELTLEKIISDTNPDNYDLSDFLEDNDFNDFTEDWVCDIYECTSTPKDLKDYLTERINEEDEDFLGMSWSIGDTYEVEGEIEDCDYKDIHSFIDHVNFDQAVQILEKCWERACKTDKVFSGEEVMQDFLNGSITSGLKQNIPKELFEFLPLERFEEQIEESITKYYDDPDEYKKKDFQKKEFPNFDEKVIDILIYLEETFGADYICEIAFDQGYSIRQVKEHFFETYQNKYQEQNEAIKK